MQVLNIGTNGTGKTYLSRILTTRIFNNSVTNSGKYTKRLTIFDPAGQYLPGFFPFQPSENEITEANPFTVFTERHEFLDYLQTRPTKSVIVIDEVLMLPKHGIDYLTELSVVRRHDKNDLIISTQRPVKLPLECIACSNILNQFRIHIARDLKHIQDYFTKDEFLSIPRLTVGQKFSKLIMTDDFLSEENLLKMMEV